MNSLTALRALPLPGGRGSAPFCYVVRVAGGWEPVNHSFVQWVVGNFNDQPGVSPCRNSTGDTVTGGGLRSTSPDTTGSASRSYSGGKIMSTTVCSHWSDLNRNSEGLMNER